jgi:hypothetical protein
VNLLPHRIPTLSSLLLLLHWLHWLLLLHRLLLLLLPRRLLLLLLLLLLLNTWIKSNRLPVLGPIRIRAWSAFPIFRRRRVLPLAAHLPLLLQLRLQLLLDARHSLHKRLVSHRFILPSVRFCFTRRSTF